MPHDHTTFTSCASPEFERWLPVPGWPDFDISHWGRIRSHLLRGDHGWCLRQQAAGVMPRVLRPGVTRSGHLRVRLVRWIDGTPERRMFGVHNLVLMAFRGPCPEGMEGCHSPDPDPANCRLENLRWDTRSENMRDVVRHGKHPHALLDEPKVRAIWLKLVEGLETTKSIAKQFGVTRQAINSIKIGHSWTHITGSLPGKPLLYQWVLDDGEIAEVRRLRTTGMMYKEIAVACGIHRSTVRRILGRCRTHNVSTIAKADHSSVSLSVPR